MALGQIPPWLHVTPPDFLSATQSGASLGLQAGEFVSRQRLAQQELAQRAAAESARQDEAEQMMAFRQQEFAAQQQEQERQSLRQSTMDAITQQYHQQQTDLAQQELQQAQQKQDLAVKTAMQKFQAQQAYQQLVQSGVAPEQALMQVGPSLGMPMAGLAQLAGRSIPFTPQAPMTQDGVTMLNTAPQRWTQARAPVPTGIEPLSTAPILDPEGNPIQNRYAYRGPTGRMTPLPTGTQGNSAIIGRQTRILENRVKALEKLQEGGTQEYLGQLSRIQASFPKLDAKEARKKLDDNIQHQIDQLNGQIDKLNDIDLGAAPEPTPATPAAPVTAAPAAPVIKPGSIRVITPKAAPASVQHPMPVRAPAAAPTNLYGQALPPPAAAAVPTAPPYAIQPDPRLASAQAYEGRKGQSKSTEALIKEAKDVLGWNVEWVPSMQKYYVNNMTSNFGVSRPIGHMTDEELQSAIDSATEGRKYEP